jgi:prevent-host-death family protein
LAASDMRSISAREANQSFSRVLSEAEHGDTVVITRRGKPVAVLAPYASHLPQGREQAIERAIELMRKGLPIGNRRFTRDEMHER